MLFYLNCLTSATVGNRTKKRNSHNVACVMYEQPQRKNNVQAVVRVPVIQRYSNILQALYYFKTPLDCLKQHNHHLDSRFLPRA